MNIDEFSNLTKDIRIDILKMITEAKSGHPGGSLSIVEILTTLYFDEMRIEPVNPKWEQRDRFVLSKGHAAPALYTVLAHRGYFPKDILMQLRKCGSILQGHPDMKKTPGVDMSTGSLGQGLSAANGMALAAKLDKADWRVYAIVGDGEIQEGQIWEAAMTSAHYGLDNLTLFVDHNGLQIDGSNEEVMNVLPIGEKFKAFGWNVLTINGHSYGEIKAALVLAKAMKGKPTVIVAETHKGRGVSFMEDEVGWHGKAPSEKECVEAVKELSGGVL